MEIQKSAVLNLIIDQTNQRPFHEGLTHKVGN